VFLCLLMILGAFSPMLSLGGTGPSETHSSPAVGTQTSHLLRLRSGTFDPVEGVPLQKDQLIKDRSDFYIVQFDGPIQDSWVTAITGLGCELIWYLPDDAYLVWSPQASNSELSVQPHVRYVGPVHPGYKVSPDLYIGPESKVVYISPLKDKVKIVEAILHLGGTVYVVGQSLIKAYVPRDKLLELAQVPEIGWMEPGGGGSFLNDNDARILYARQNVDGNFTNDGLSLWSWNGTAFQGTTGKGIKVMVTDTGVDGTHPAFDGRKIYFSTLNAPYTNWTDYFGHGTHCAGIILGNGSYRGPPAPQGINGTYAGVAPEALLMGEIIDWDANDDLKYGRTVEDIINDTEQHGAQVSSNSWSCCGVVQTYGITASIYDDAVRDSNKTAPGNQSIVYVFAAGNSGPGNIITPGVAKNVITVGATGDRKGGYDENYLTGFSSRGPVADGRRKPDVVAPGLYIMSAYANTPNFSYVSMSGTSMATPGVAGASTLIIDYLNKTYGLSPSPAMVKAILINGADQLLNPSYKYADSNQGWGRVNLSRSLLETDGRKVWGEDQQHLLTTGQSVDYYFNVTATKELRVHMAYTDPGASPMASKALVNDLDLVAFAPNGTAYNGSHFVNDYSATGGSSDVLNNTEGFRFKDPAIGKWHVRVKATDIPKGPQDYALTINGWTDISLHDIDLRAIDIQLSNTTPLEGDSVHWSTHFINEGLVPTGLVTYNIKLDGTLIKEGSYPSLLRHETIEITGDWNTTRGNHIFSMEVDPKGLLKETNENNNVVMADLFVYNYGLVVEARANTTFAPPGGIVHWAVVVNNTGTLPDTYDLKTGQVPNGWTLTAPVSVQLEPGSGKVLVFDIGTPVVAYAGTRLVLPLTITSKNLATLTEKVLLQAIVSQVFSFEMSAGPNEQVVAPDSSMKYNITITNKGNGFDSFWVRGHLSSKGTTLWQFDVLNPTVQLNPGGAAVVQVEIYASPDALAGDNCTLDLTVASVGQTDIVAHGTVYATAGARHSLVSSLVKDYAAVAPGKRANFTLVVMNLGNLRENVTYSVRVPPGWTSPVPTKIVLAPGGIMQFMVPITVPENALAGNYQFELDAMNPGGPVVNIIGVHFFTVTVLPVLGLSLEVEPLRLNGTAGDPFDLRIAIKDTGNVKEEVQILVEGLEPEWALTSEHFVFELTPGKGILCTTHIQTTNDTAGNYTLHVSALYGDKRTPSVAVPLSLKAPPVPNPPVIPPPKPKPKPQADNSWLFSALLVLFLLSVIIGVLIIVLLLRMRKREKAATHPVMPPPSPVPTQQYPKDPGPSTMPITADPEVLVQEPVPQGPVTEQEVSDLIAHTSFLIKEAVSKGKNVETPNNLLRLAESFQRSHELEKARTYAYKAKQMVQDLLKS
jgi:serine protease AprX